MKKIILLIVFCLLLVGCEPTYEEKTECQDKCAEGGMMYDSITIQGLKSDRIRCDCYSAKERGTDEEFARECQGGC